MRRSKQAADTLTTRPLTDLQDAVLGVLLQAAPEPLTLRRIAEVLNTTVKTPSAAGIALGALARRGLVDRAIAAGQVVFYARGVLGGT